MKASEIRAFQIQTAKSINTESQKIIDSIIQHIKKAITIDPTIKQVSYYDHIPKIALTALQAQEQEGGYGFTVITRYGRNETYYEISWPEKY
jgi:uncharacterized protein (DUF305 family)